MNADPAPAARAPSLATRALSIYQGQTGQTVAGWALLALLSFITQIIFRHELQPGEFGSLNTALGVIGLMTAPVLAVHLAYTHYFGRSHGSSQSEQIESLRASALLVTETVAWVWGGVAVLLILLFLPLLSLPRSSLQLFTLVNVLIALGGVVSWAICQGANQIRLWAILTGIAAAVRLLAGTILGWQEPWAESGLAAFLLAGFITLIPTLRHRASETVSRWKACQAAGSSANRDFLLCAGSTLSVLVALQLFTNADRIVAQSSFGTSTNNNMGLVNWDQFDAYQTAGLLARALLWGTQPLLWILFAERAQLDRTRTASLTFFWIYLGTLFIGAILVGCLAQPLSWLFCGAQFQATAIYVPSLCAVMLPLGLLQGLGIFSLASRRHPECFVLGACSIGYTLLLYFAGRQPQLMPAYMFGGALVSLMIVLFIGVVRWGRKQP